MTDNRHNNGTADLTHRDIYTVPNGFFEAEKQRLSALARGPWQARRRRNRRLIWGTTATAAAAAIACLVVPRPHRNPRHRHRKALSPWLKPRRTAACTSTCRKK